jgi:hypothetical protein
MNIALLIINFYVKCVFDKVSNHLVSGYMLFGILRRQIRDEL